ncbi:transcriptional regulator, LacI family [Shimia gijangensis]|uniref:Transcriptional regulator, LacI family n=1 Tax=Shimia gijangensis TaxID=1470563 RepID=A0A1M6CL12_9RHOB|nr:LacI family DNA-binding transcriptional regulator [Shimia gijangensis]SHI61697.1 transcriptional regulator, LacI family [Shimia gijangensis]
MTKPLVLKDIARLAGVSEMTASRALRDAPDVAKATRAKIQKIATELGYVPNRIAGSLASQSVRLVGVVVPSLSSFVFPEVLSGITKGLSSGPLKPVIGVTGYDLNEEEEVIREMLSWRPSGVIVAGLEHTDAARAMLAAAACPVVEIMDVDGDPVAHCVGISHFSAGRGMAATILGKGYRKIGFIGTKMEQDYRANKRLTGFQDYLQANGLEVADLERYSGQSSIETGRELTETMLARTPDIECIYYSSDLMAVGGMMHCLSNGLSVPGDIALCGFNNLELLRGLPIELATTDAHRFEIGLKASEIILANQQSDETRPDTVVELHPVVSFGASL